MGDLHQLLALFDRGLFLGLGLQRFEERPVPFDTEPPRQVEREDQTVDEKRCDNDPGRQIGLQREEGRRDENHRDDRRRNGRQHEAEVEEQVGAEHEDDAEDNEMGQRLLMRGAQRKEQPGNGAGYDGASGDHMQHRQRYAAPDTQFNRGKEYDAHGKARDYQPDGDVGKQKPIEDAVGHVAQHGSPHAPAHDMTVLTGIALQQQVHQLGVGQAGTWPRPRFNDLSGDIGG